jgi:hypothetical protein
MKVTRLWIQTDLCFLEKKIKEWGENTRLKVTTPNMILESQERMVKCYIATIGGIKIAMHTRNTKTPVTYAVYIYNSVA